MENLTKKLLLLFGLFIAPGSNLLASESETREELKQEILHELLQSDVLKQYIIKEIKLYELEKVSLQKKQKQQRQNTLTQQVKQKIRPVSPLRDHIYGDPTAAASIIEFSDFECPYCRKIHPVLKRLVNDSGGQVNWVFRHYPLSFHKPNAQREAEASECAYHMAGNDGFLPPRIGCRISHFLYDHTKF